MKIYKHKKSGGLYVVIDDSASLQCSSDPGIEEMFEDCALTIYRFMFPNAGLGGYCVRPTEEFLDGRFELVKEE